MSVGKTGPEQEQGCHEGVNYDLILAERCKRCERADQIALVPIESRSRLQAFSYVDGVPRWELKALRYKVEALK